VGEGGTTSRQGAQKRWAWGDGVIQGGFWGGVWKNGRKMVFLCFSLKSGVDFCEKGEKGNKFFGQNNFLPYYSFLFFSSFLFLFHHRSYALRWLVHSLKLNTTPSESFAS